MKNWILLSMWIYLFSIPIARADDESFSWGIGFLSMELNQYRGSDQSRFWIYPTPYFTYKSKYIEAEPSLIRGVLYRDNFFSLKLSLMAGLNVESKSNEARKGMSELGYTFEIGPLVIFHLMKSNNKEFYFNLNIPIRHVFATNFHYIHGLGWFSVPYLSLTLNKNNIESEFSIGPMYEERSLHGYYYDVAIKDRAEGRDVYHANGGYSGIQSALVTHIALDHYTILNFLRWDNLSGARFEKSPLVKMKNYFVFGLGIYWMFK